MIIYYIFSLTVQYMNHESLDYIILYIKLDYFGYNYKNNIKFVQLEYKYKEIYKKTELSKILLSI